jgi:hypothetical protein
LALSAFCFPFSSWSSTIRLKPVPTGSTNTRSLKASHDSSFMTSCGGIRGSDPSGGNPTRDGPAAPMCRYADDAPGPPLKMNVTGRSPSTWAMYETAKISAAGRSSLRRTIHFALAV